MSQIEELHYLCDICGNMYSNLIPHKLCQSRPSYQCSKCVKSFTKIKYLKQHMKTHEICQIKCNFCEKILRSKVNLIRHIKLLHSKVYDEWNCNICNAKFKEKHNLTKHMKIHSEPLFQCPFCNKKFRHNYLKTMHVKQCSP